MGQDVCLISSRESNQLFLFYVLNSVGADQLEVEKVGSTFSRANISQILELKVPAPAPADQERFAQLMDRRQRESRRLVDANRRQIELLVERRQALITAAVTGELEIPGVAA